MRFESEIPLLELEIPQGGTVEFTVDVIGGPTTLTGYTGAMQIREMRSSETVLAEISPNSITVNADTRQVTVRIPSEETSEYDFRSGVYDLLIIGPSGDAWRICEGRATLSLAVTRGA
jgi:hypothetical protein